MSLCLHRSPVSLTVKIKKEKKKLADKKTNREKNVDANAPVRDAASCRLPAGETGEKHSCELLKLASESAQQLTHM